MTTVREIMTGGVECVLTSDTATLAGRKMRDLGVGSLPICGQSNRLQGMVSDRDIVLMCIAEGHDADAMTMASYVEGEPVTIGADDPVEEALRTMTEAGVRRLPVIDGHDLIGMVTQADVARGLSAETAGELVAAISSGRAID